MTMPEPRLRDHVRVAGLLGLTLLGLLPVLVWIALSPILRPLVRSIIRRRLVRPPDPPAEPPAPDPEAWAGRTLFVVAGEASGDLLAARVVRSMKAQCPGLRVRGYAGPATAAAGAELDRDIVDHAVMGITAVVATLGFWWRVCAQTLALFREDPPDVFFTVDFPGLNGRLARWARKAGIPTLHLVAPAVWGYMPWRLARWRRAVDHMLTTFPFEESLFSGSGIPSSFVGHPLFERPLPPPRTPDAWPGAGPCLVELLPGSRRQELAFHGSVMLEAAAVIQARLPEARFRVVLARAEHRALFDAAAEQATMRPTEVEFVVGRDPDAQDALPLLGAVACSGTVTAELATDCVPMAVVYRTSPFLRLGVLVGLTAPYIALANLCAGKEVVPERVQVSARGTPLAEEFLSVVGTAASWQACRDDLDRLVRQRIAVDHVAARAARVVLYESGVLLAASRSARPVGASTTSSNPAGGPS